MRLPIALFVPLFVLCQVGAAAAQEEAARAAARVLAQEGAQLFEKDDLPGALAKFQQAYDKFPSPKLFLNLGQALRGLGRNVEALAAFERFLAEAKDAGPEFVELASTQVAELGAKLARIVVESNHLGTEVWVDDEKRGATPLEQPIVVEPGAHRLRAVWDGESKTVEVTVSAGQYLRQAIYFEERKWPLVPAVPPPFAGVPAVAPTPEPAPAALVQPAQEPPPPAPSRISRRMWYIVIGGAVVVAAVTTTLVVLYGRQYPDATLGSRTIGGSP